MSDERVYRVSMDLPVSFDVLASTEVDARNKVRRLSFGLAKAHEDRVINYAIGFYELSVAPVQSTDSEAAAS